MADITVSADIHAFLQTSTDALARTELGVDASGTDNSTDVTLAGTGTYISIAGQVITVDGITESDITDLGTYLTDLTGDALSTVSDVTITAIASGEILKWNGSAWINNTLAEAGISATSHTHTASDVTDFDTEVANNTAVAANTAKTGITAQQASDITANNAKVTYDDAAAVAANTSKVTNATHTGDVTGATVLTIAAGAVDLAMLSATGTASGTTFLRGDNTWATPAAGGAVDSVNTQTGVVVLDADDISDAATTNKFATAAELSAISANTAKTTNATHTGDVTGDVALTVESVAVTGQTLVTAVGTDHVLIADASDSGSLKKALISDFASAGGDMAASTYDPAAIAEQVVGTTATQTLTNKTLTSPAVNTPTGIVTNDITESTNKNFVTDAESVVIANTSGTNTGDQVLPTDFDPAGTDNSTNVTLAGTGTYLSIAGQAITVDPITESDISDLGTYSTATGVADNADVTNTSSVTAAGALMDSEVTNLAQVKAFASTDYATAAQGTTADAALPKAGGAVTGAITTTSTFDGRDVATDGTKLDGIEESADVTDATNVTSAGALMDSEVTNLAQVKAFSSADYATAAQGTTADAALPKAGGAMTGAITTNSTIDGRDVATDGAKLDTITVADITANTAKVTNATHTGDVTGDVALTIAAGAVDVSMLANGTDGELITWDAAGAPATVPAGTAAQVLTSNGAGAAPTFQAAAGGNSAIDSHLNTSSASSNQVLSWNGSDYAWTAQSGGSSSNTTGTTDRIISIDAGALVARTTDGAATATEEYGTNDVMSDHFLFDGATEEGVQFRFHMPADWDGNAVNAKFYWDAATGASASDGVTWGIAMQAFQNDDALDNAFATSVDTDDALIAVGDLHVTAESADITIAGSPSAGDLVFAEVTRVVADANDTMTEDAKLVGVTIHYSATTPTDYLLHPSRTTAKIFDDFTSYGLVDYNQLIMCNVGSLHGSGVSWQTQVDSSSYLNYFRDDDAVGVIYAEESGAYDRATLYCSPSIMKYAPTDGDSMLFECRMKHFWGGTDLDGTISLGAVAFAENKATGDTVHMGYTDTTIAGIYFKGDETYLKSYNKADNWGTADSPTLTDITSVTQSSYLNTWYTLGAHAQYDSSNTRWVVKSYFNQTLVATQYITDWGCPLSMHLTFYNNGSTDTNFMALDWASLQYDVYQTASPLQLENL